MCTSEAHGGVLGEPKATVLEKDSPTAQQVLQRDYATLVEDVHFSGLDGASKLAQLAEDLCLATLNPLKRRNIEQRLRRFVEHSNPTLQQWLALQRWLHKYVGDLPPEIFRVVDLCATGQPWDRMDPTIATSLSALRKSWAETHEVLVQATGEFSVNWTDPRYLEYADRALQVHDIMTYALTLHERRSLITRLNIFNTMKRPTRIIARDRLMRSIAMHTRAASVYDEHGRKQPVDLAPLIVWLINGHDAILEPPPGWATAGTSPTEIRDTAGHLAMLQPIPIISALLLQVREIVTTLAEGSDPAVQDEGPEGAARRSKLKLVRELSVAGTMPLFDLDAVAPSDTERRAAREEFLRNERNKTTSVYKTNLTLRGLVPIVEMDSVGDESVAVELERDLHERLSAVPRNATRTVRHFVTGGGVAESIRASNNRADEMARVDNTTWVFEQEKAAAMEQRGLPLLRDGDDDAAPRSGALGPFPVYLDHIDANVTPQAILNAFQASVGGVTYVETRRGTVHALEVAAAAEEAKLAAFALEIEASGASGDGADGGDVGDGGEGRGHAAFGLENHFERQGTRTIMGDVDEALGPISSSEETTKWMEWKSEQLAKERAAEEERERTSTMNPFLDDDGLEESGDVEAIEALGAFFISLFALFCFRFFCLLIYSFVCALEAYLIESDHSAGSGGVDAAFTSRMVEDGDEEEEANGAVEEPLLDDTLQGKMTRKYGVIEYNARKKK
jgi:hypothetical protein